MEVAQTHLVFSAGTGLYALPSETAQEVVTFVRLTPVPGAPPHVLGILPHRGEVIPVVDWARLTGGAPETSQRAVVVRDPRGTYALTLRAVLGISVLEGTPEPRGPDGLDATLKTGVRSADGEVRVIDPGGLFELLSLARHQ